MVKAKVYIFQTRFTGFPKAGDLKLIEEELPPLRDKEFLAEAIFLSVDPYMWAYAPALPLGTTFIGSQVAKIIESRNNHFKVSDVVVGNFGWRTHTVSSGDQVKHLLDFQGLPLSLGLGVLGMPGNSAYFGFLDICKPKLGETVVVSGAAGAVGSIVGQIAKIKGCKVIGIAGSDQKGRWLIEELEFDHFINYKTKDVKKELKRLAPQGVDCYFDNVGGEMSAIIMLQMNMFGRISVCGAISGYDDRNIKASLVQPLLVRRQLKMEGFTFTRWDDDRWNEGILQNLRWIKQGKLKYRETITIGFENMFEAFTGMLRGDNTGKSVVKVLKCSI